MKKITRTISGVTPIAVMTYPFPCPGKCVYCPTFPFTPQSYTTESPAALRARRHNYDAKRQIKERLKTLQDMGHPTDKIELIIMGGTFLALPLDYQYQFMKDCYDALNEEDASSLKEAQLLNERAKHRAVGLCIETRPDYCGDEEIERMLEFGTTRVELGVQTLDEDVYKLIRRGHTVKEVIDATKLLKERGFKVYYHWMPGLPGSNPQKDLELTAQLFSNPDFRPDGLKLYPTLVVEGTELEEWYQQGRFRPYDQDELVSLLIKIQSLIPKYVRVSRVMRDIPSKFIVAGCRDSALRQIVEKRMREMGLSCKCIRCREYGHRLREGWRIGKPELWRVDYEASGGREIFLSYEDENETLFGLLRLRIPFNGDWAIVRELHIFGPELPLGERGEKGIQHQGLGKNLLMEAERIAQEELRTKGIAVLSGIGAKEYYRNLGYKEEGYYLIKEFIH